LLFVHPNPMDASCWTFQMAHLSDRFRTIAVDLPGYGRSPSWQGPFDLDEVAAACWTVLDEESSSPVAIVGCSVGAHVAMRMAVQRPDGLRALALSGTGHHPVGQPKGFASRRRAAFEDEGLAYRRRYLRENFSSGFRDTAIARWFEELCLARGPGDLSTILALFDAASAPDPEGFHDGLQLPVLVMGGGEDKSHRRAAGLVDQLPDAEVVTLAGAGHACHVEQPWEYDRHLLDFLERRAGLP
jgi:pimeloyl-ACP methyl ester carboxylesterase